MVQTAMDIGIYKMNKKLQHFQKPANPNAGQNGDMTFGADS